VLPGSVAAMSAAARKGFVGSGPIGSYWQTRCCGFEVRSVRGRLLGEVEALEFDRETRAAVSLLVGRRRRKPLRVRTECVRIVDPWRQLLVIELPRRKPVVAPAARSVARGARGSVSRTVSPAARCVARGARASGARTVALGRGTRRAAPGVASGIARTVSWAAPRAFFVAGLVAWLYAVAVFTLVRTAVFAVAALTLGTARGGARIKPHLHGRPARV
jgi:hypothetical protein